VVAQVEVPPNKPVSWLLGYLRSSGGKISNREFQELFLISKRPAGRAFPVSAARRLSFDENSLRRASTAPPATVQT
jgi:hypothetical protein